MTDKVVADGLFFGMLLIALLHALLPTHWLSFVLVARAQGWKRSKMMRVVLVSGFGHVTTTTIVGLAAAALSKGFHEAMAGIEAPLAAFVLGGFGLYYLVMGWRREGHRHCTHDHSDDPPGADKVAIGALFIEMTLSPCETLIPIFLASGALPWALLITMAIAMSAITIAIMGVLAYLAYSGYEKLTFPWLERNERLILGVLLMSLGAFAFIVE